MWLYLIQNLLNNPATLFDVALFSYLSLEITRSLILSIFMYFPAFFINFWGPGPVPGQGPGPEDPGPSKTC